MRHAMGNSVGQISMCTYNGLLCMGFMKQAMELSLASKDDGTREYIAFPKFNDAELKRNKRSKQKL